MNRYIRISFAGDAMLLGEEQNRYIQRKNGVFDDYLKGLNPLIKDSRYSVANLETPVSPSQALTNHSIQFNSHKSFIEAIQRTGFHFLSTANNHCLDRGIIGINETIEVLDTLGLDHSGTYQDEALSNQVFIKEICGIRIAIVCSTFGTNSQHNGIILQPQDEWRVDLLKKQAKPRRYKFNPSDNNLTALKYLADDVSPAAITNQIHLPYLKRVLSKITKAKQEADIVIALPHIGGQYNPGPGEYTKFIVHSMCDAGADVIIAGHPHTSHRCEIVKKDGEKKLCAYSLGNMCFTPEIGYYCQNTLADYGIILHLYLNISEKRIEKVSFDVTKCICNNEGFTIVVPVASQYNDESNLEKKEKLVMENEAVVNRFRGSMDSVLPQLEYFFPF